MFSGTPDNTYLGTMRPRRPKSVAPAEVGPGAPARTGAGDKTLYLRGSNEAASEAPTRMSRV
jgi:hypothetical protein